MASFSQRKGLKPIKISPQLDSMDSDLRTALWNALQVCYWDNVVLTYYGSYTNDPIIQPIMKKLWVSYFKFPLDTLPSGWDETYGRIREFYFKCPWNEVYDFIEFIANASPNPLHDRFVEYCNVVLEREVSAYRFIGGRISEITSQQEINEIEKALASPLKGVNEHFKRSLELLTDRKNPDFRNSIKESISAVEALCAQISGERTTLGQALNKIEGKVKLHGALKSAFSSLYGYTSAADGIRHALLEESNIEFEDAKFMLVSCSTFVNYLLVKATKAGIRI